MEFTDSLKLNYEFRRAYRKGRSAAEPCLVVYARRNGKAGNRLGFTVSNKLGCAVVRNRIRRLMRENIRLMQYDMRPGQYVFIARAPAAQADYKTFHKSLRYIFRREGLLLEAENGRRQDS